MAEEREKIAELRKSDVPGIPCMLFVQNNDCSFKTYLSKRKNETQEQYQTRTLKYTETVAKNEKVEWRVRV